VAAGKVPPPVPAWPEMLWSMMPAELPSWWLWIRLLPDQIESA
jgi:hypothetical protein